MKKGLTLIELMVVLLIFTIVFSAIFAILTVGRSSWQIGNMQIQVQQEARRAMEAMTRQLRGASNIDPYSFADGVSVDYLKFTLEGEVVEFTVNETRQLQRISGATTRVLANNIGDERDYPLQFHLLGGGVVYITLTAKGQTESGYLVRTSLNSQVLLRN